MDRADRETVSSAVTVKTDTGSKVLPGDKQGLPYEVWAIILSYLPVEDLCRSAMVCKTWYEVVVSLDHTRWRELYLTSNEWRHPYWPLNLQSEPRSWRQAYRDQHVASTFWTQIDNRPIAAVSCMSVFKRTKLRKTITVGVGKAFESLKGALGVANDYDRILVYPGIYDEQFEMSSKMPFELIGVGELGSVILVVCIEQAAITGRINNLVFRAPWFTNFIMKVRSGYLQVDNCIFEDGMVYVQNPGTITMSFCTFRHATIILQHVNASVIQNCMFSQTDSAAITVEGYPKEDRNWTNGALNSKIMKTCTLQKKLDKHSEGLLPKSAFSLSTATTSNVKSGAKSYLMRRYSLDTDTVYQKLVKQPRSHDVDLDTSKDDVPLLGAMGGSNEHHLLQRRNSHCGTESNFSHVTHDNAHDCDLDDCKRVSNKLGTHAHSYAQSMPPGAPTLSMHNLTQQNISSHNSRHQKEKIKRIESFVSDCAKYGSTEQTGEITHGEGEHCQDDLSPLNDLDFQGHSQDHIGHQAEHYHHRPHNYHHHSNLLLPTNLNFPNHNASIESDEDIDLLSEKPDCRVPALDLHSLRSHDRHDNPPVVVGNEGEGARARSLSSSEVSIHTASSNDVSDEDPGSNSVDSDMSSSTDDDGAPLSDDSEFSSSEESVIMLTYPDRHQPRSLSAQKDVNDVTSINSQNQSEHIDIIQDNDMRKVLSDVRGCLVHKCRITQSKGAVMVSMQAHAIIMECEINSVGYGIRCIQNSMTVVLKNEIHHCRTSAVFMRLAASGLVTGNDIHSNCEAGIDIRKNADPIVQCNRIHHGKRSGVVVLGSGRGQIRHNDIYQNKEAGVYILYRGNPTVSNNQIYSGKAAGIAVNEGGRGYIHGNVITGNQWGGIDIRHGGDPVIHQNTVCNGISDGIVIGEGGRGTIQNNIITGNAGCGVWVMAAHQPLIHGNEIHSNRDSGISMVNRTDSSPKDDSPSAQSKETPTQSSMDFWGLVQDQGGAGSGRTVTVATLEYNKVFNNEGKGISVQFGESVMIDSNIVHGNKSDGICVDQACPVTLTSNCVTFNSGSGVMVTGQGKASIVGNGIYDNRDHGIWCQCEAEILENDILGNNWSAVLLKNVTMGVIKNNRLHSSNDFLVCLTGVRRCVVEDNVFYGPGDKTISADSGSKCTSIANQVLTAPLRQANSARRMDLPTLTPLGTATWLLVDPTPRPHLVTPPAMSHAPQNQTAITRITVPAENCDRGSRLCTII
ncbi:F-box only protein 10-like isoform X2 [Dreissena polymorpha]|uniref:F-box only protein 10-like isoform X2 n=1 Tax=Dreissena polymorpha TaxID=45954 RepID=UPI0022650350|nr:F-box only protein 10-like isoform X2 [Dreissena polymorpha]